MQGEAAVKAEVHVDGKDWLVTCVSMGNPHAVTFGTSDGEPIKVLSPHSCFRIMGMGGREKREFVLSGFLLPAPLLPFVIWECVHEWQGGWGRGGDWTVTR